MPALATWRRWVIMGTSIGTEIWQTGFSGVNTTDPATQAALQAQCNATEPAVTAFWNACKSHIYSSFAYTGIKVFQYVGANTHAQFQAQTLVTPNPGTLVANSSPIDTALVLSLRTPLPTRQGRGRMYMPCHDLVQPAAGAFIGTPSATYAAAFKTMLNAVAAAGSDVFVVASRTGSQYNVLSSVIADNKPDVQRRRENKITPTITTVLSLP